MSRQEGVLEEGRYGTPTPLSPQHGFNPAGASEMPSAYAAQSGYYSGQYNRVSEMPSAYTATGGSALHPDLNPPLHTIPPPRFHEKPPLLAPVQFGATGAGAAMGMGMQPKEKRICGLRRKVFFIILGAITILIIAGLAAGLAIALTRKNSNSSRDSQPDGTEAGPTSSSSAGSRTTPQSQPSPTPEDNDPFVPSIGPTETSEPTTSEPPTPTTTRPRPTPPPSSTPPSDGLITPTLSPETTPRTPSTPTVSAFALETGYNTLALTVTSTTGNRYLCSLLIEAIPVTTTIYPSIAGNVEDFYTAYWQLDNYPGTLSATGTPPEPTDRYQFWSFEVPVRSNSGGCVQEGADGIALEESGVAIYSSGFTFRSQCAVSGIGFRAGDFCYVYWVGEYYS